MPRPTLPLVLAVLGSLCTARPAQAQNQVANYAFGTPGTAAYEHFSFWTMDRQRTDMQYAHGKDHESSQLRYAGPVRLHGQPGFRVRLENGRLLYVQPSGTALLVATSPTATPKAFAWEYEGPVNGVGTVCSVCAPDAAAAMRLVQRHYLR